MDLQDGIGSKKLWFSVGSAALAFVFAFLAGKWFPGMKDMYSGFLGFLEFVTATYVGGNLINKVAAAKLGPVESKNGKDN